MHRVLSAIRLLECVFCIWHIWYLVFGDSKIRSFGYCVNRFVHKLVSFYLTVRNLYSLLIGLKKKQ